MKRKKRNYKLAAIALAALFVFACQDESNDNDNDVVSGICGTPSSEPPAWILGTASIEHVADVFELKYGEVKEWYYKRQTFKFTITDVEDKLLNCSVMDIPPEDSENVFENIRMNVYMRMTIDNLSKSLDVSSQECGLYEYRNDDTDIREVWDLLESWQATTDNWGNSCFQGIFLQNIGTGTPFGDSFRIFIAKAYPIAYKSEYNVEKSQYKFIFIVTSRN
jgi:hypothetical protein